MNKTPRTVDTEYSHIFELFNHPQRSTQQIKEALAQCPFELKNDVVERLTQNLDASGLFCLFDILEKPTSGTGGGGSKEIHEAPPAMPIALLAQAAAGKALKETPEAKWDAFLKSLFEGIVDVAARRAIETALNMVLTDDRGDFAIFAAPFVRGIENGHQRALILNTLSGLPAGEREAFARLAASLIEDVASNHERLYVLVALIKVPAGERESFVLHAAPLFQGITNGHQRALIITALREGVPEAHRAEAARRALQRINAQMTGGRIGSIIKNEYVTIIFDRLVDIPVDDFELMLGAVARESTALKFGSEELQKNKFLHEISALEDNFWHRDTRIEARIDAFITSQGGGGAAAFQGAYIPDAQNATRLCLQDWRYLKFAPAAVRYNRGFVLGILKQKNISLEQAIFHFSASGPNRDILLATFIYDELFNEVYNKIPMSALLSGQSVKKKQHVSRDIAQFIYRGMLGGKNPTWNWQPLNK